MSIALCKICDALVDTDAHPEAFYEVYSYAAAAQPSSPQPPPDYECLCIDCAEQFVDEDGYFHPKGIEIGSGKIPSINHLTQRPHTTIERLHELHKGRGGTLDKVEPVEGFPFHQTKRPPQKGNRR